MSRYGDATILRVSEDGVDYAVVERADEIVGISFELLHDAAEATGEEIRGGLVVDDEDPDLISFGTEGRGLGRLTYRILERNEADQMAVARRVS